MKKFMQTLLLSTMLLLCGTVFAQSTGRVNGYDIERTTWYNNVVLTNAYDTIIGKASFSYDTSYYCYNNIKYYNYESTTGYYRLKVWINNSLFVSKKVWLEKGTWTYLDDEFYNCNSSAESIQVSLTTW